MSTSLDYQCKFCGVVGQITHRYSTDHRARPQLGKLAPVWVSDRMRVLHRNVCDACGKRRSKIWLVADVVDSEQRVVASTREEFEGLLLTASAGTRVPTG